MPPLTLEQIQAEHQRLGALIAELQVSAETAQPQTYVIPEASIELGPGERYAGLVLDDAGAPLHHLVLLPGEADGVTWDAAKTWADLGPGELPTRQEQALLYANLKGAFQPEWYWSSEEHASDGSYAWGQGFVNGGQYSDRKSYEGRARAVRRFPA